MIHLQFIYLVKSVSDLINVICGNYFCQGHWRKCSNFCIKYIDVCQASIKLFQFLLFVKRYHISLTMNVHQVHHPQNHMAYMYMSQCLTKPTKWTKIWIFVFWYFLIEWTMRFKMVHKFLFCCDSFSRYWLSKGRRFNEI